MIRLADGYRLSTGREFSANHGLVSLALDADGQWEIGEGYDGAVDDTPWTPAERAELADHMIALWTAWKTPNPPN